MTEPDRSSRSRVRVRLAIGVVVALSIARVSAQIVPGPNVNMVSGRTWPNGDPFLQKQDEGSIAVSSRNVLHLVGSANDYRTVDLPGLPTGKATGDAWLGLFKSFDGGKTWTSALIPGYPQDASAIGMMSPLKGYDAGADPLVRAGSNGLFYYSGIVFQRAAIQDTAPVGAAPGDASKKGLTARDRKRDRERARQLERKQEQEHEKERKLKKERERRRKLEGARNGKPARAGDANRRPREELADGGFDDDEEAGVDGTKSAIFVSTLIDLNNRENGDPISLVRTTLVDRDGGDRFLDKQWMAVDVPRAGAQMCVLDVPENSGGTVRQSFPGGRVYVVYTAFTGAPPNQKAQILFAYSSDCGATWSRPHDISTVPDPDVTDDGVVNNADLNLIKASFGKQCGDAGFNPTADTNGDCIVNVLDLTYVSRSVGRAFPTTPRRVPQGANIAIDPLTGTVYVAWREFKTATQPDAIQVVRSTDFGITFSTPRTIASFSPFDQKTSGTTFRTSAFPTLTADGQRVYAAWSARGFAAQRDSPVDGDARIMMSTSPDGLAWTQPRVVDEGGVPGHQIMPALTFGAGKISLLYNDLREDVSRLFQKQVDEQEILANPLALRHTMDARIGQADPGVAPVFTSVRLSSYSSGVLPGSNQVQQLQFNPPNLKIAQKGGAAFMGDYVDVTASPTIRANDDGTWAFNIEPTTSSAGHAIWTDNRDVRAGPGGDLTNYTPPNSASRHDTSLYDPTQILPPCVADFTGTRDQNVYTARFDNGLFAGALGNSKPLDDVQRAFALFVENATTRARSYRLSIPQQPTGGQATFEQFSAPQAPVTRLDVTIPPRSTIARSVYVNSTVSMERVVVNVDEIDAPQAPAPIPGGRHGAILINGDSSAPAIENPAIENPAIENRPIATVEVYTPIVSKGVSAPAIENPAIENPAIENNSIPSVSEANASIVHPAIENPAIENVAIRTPAIENPAIENTDLVNGSISDTTWELTNGGNTAAAFAVKLLLNGPIPLGFKTQLVVHKTYTTPAAEGCDLKSQLHNVVLLNIISPAFTDPARAGDPAIENPAIENATVALAPGEIANVTFRVFDPDKNDAVKFDTLAAVTPVAVAQSVNSEDAHDPNNPNPRPPVAIGLTISPPQVPDAFLTGGQYQQILRANVAGRWAITAGALPPGLTLDPATGRISGVPTAPGTFTFIVTFTDTATPPHSQSQTFTIHVGGPLAIVTTSLPDAVANVSNLVAINATGGIGLLTWSVSGGTLPPGLILNTATGAILGTPTIPGTYSFTLTVRDSGVPQSSVSQSYSLNVTGETFDKVWSGTDTIWENPANWSPAGIPTAATTVLIPGGLARQPILSTDVVVKDLHLAPGATLETNGHRITVSGNLDAGNTIVGTGTVRMTGAPANLKGTVPNLIVAGSASLNGDVHVNGDLTVDGTLQLAGFPIVVSGRVISLTNPLAKVEGGARVLSATSVAGEWSGTILTTTGGPVTPIPATFTVQQAGTHLTARSPQFSRTVIAADQTGITPGGAVEFTATATSTDPGACSPAVLSGVITIDPATNALTGSISGLNTNCAVETDTFTLRSGSTLKAGGVNTNSLTFDNVVVTFDNGAIEQFDNVVFQSALPEVLQLRINHPGTPGASSFSGVRFFVTPTTGFYIFATDTAPADGNVLTIDLLNATADNGPAHTLVAGGAVVNWIGQAADLSVSQLRSPNAVFVGNTVTYTVTVTNGGPNGVNNVTLVDTLPVGAPLVSTTPSQGSCAVAAGVVTCNLGALASGSSATVAIAVAANAIGPLENTAAVSSTTADPVAANNVSTDTTTVQAALAADVSISKSHVPLQPVVGQNLTYVVTVTNNGPAAATQVVMTDTLPASVTFVSVSDASCSRVGVTVTCLVTSLANGASATFSITVTPTVAQPITNTAAVSAAQADPVVANNTVSDPAMILAFGPCGAATFSGPYNYVVGPNNTDAVGDFNHDGKLDIAVTIPGQNQVALLFGNGAGQFAAPTYVATGTNPTHLDGADFNGDGLLDLVTANSSNSSSVSILLNQGNGTFSAPTNIALGLASSFQVVAGDFNGDGKPDLVVGFTAGTQIAVLLNNGDGTFGAPTLYTTGPMPGNVVVDDFDGDGKVDLAVSNRSGTTVSILKGVGNGTFGAPTDITIGTGPRARGVGDLNGDGKPDLEVQYVSGGENKVALLFNNGSGGFGPLVDIPGFTNPGVAVGVDVNGDGKRDIAILDGLFVKFLLGDGTGGFSPAVSYGTGGGNGLSFGDFNGDGAPDFTSIGPSSEQVWVLLNNCPSAQTVDLQVHYTAGTPTVTAGQHVSFTATTTNQSTVAAHGLTLSGAVGNGLEVDGVSAPGASCSFNGSSWTCGAATLAGGGTLVATVDVKATAAGVRTATATVTANEGDPNPADNSAAASVTVTAGAVTFTVTNTNDSGTGSLRQAIGDSNLNVGSTNQIAFNIAGTGPFTIAPTTGLPVITVPVVIDGTTQPGFTGTPIVELNGSNTVSTGFNITAGGTTIRGLVINRFTSNGIFIGTNGNDVIEGNYVGTNVAGTAALPNGTGISIGSGNNRVGGTGAAQRNVISGNNSLGISLNAGSGTGNTVVGNYIGTNAGGSAAVPNTNGGIFIGSSSNIIGGAAAGSRNVISGNGSPTVGAYGINIGAGVLGTQILGNYIGLDAGGTTALANTGNGICLCGGSGTIVGGAASGAGNVISGNGPTTAFYAAGINIVNSNGNSILGNRIGTNPAGTSAIPNVNAGISISTSNNNIIGGATAGAGNLISGNGLAGHFAPGINLNLSSTGNQILGNTIGADTSGALPIPNLHSGVFLSAPGNTVGGTATGAGNRLAFNSVAGVTVSSGTGNAIRGNAITSNAGQGIDLGDNGSVAPNDTGDGDTGANNLQNFPLLARANPGTTVAGTLNSTASTTFAVDFFANAACDASGNGEGQRYLGSSNVTTNASGDGSFSVNLSGAAVVGEVVTATATDPNGNTSEFSPCVAVTNAGAQTFTVTSTADSGAGSLRQAILNSNLNTGFTNTIRFAVGSGPITIAPTSGLPTISAAVVVDGTTQPGFSGTPIVELNGAGAGFPSGFNITAGGSTIRGFVINRFAVGISIASNDGNVIEGNYIGTNVAGTAALGNFAGILIESQNNRVGGTLASQRNLISGNGPSPGILIRGATGNSNIVQGNYVGTDVNGTTRVANTGAGVQVITGTANTIGGTSVNARNVISGNTGNGVSIRSGANGNFVQGNYLGTDRNGTAALGNGGAGVIIGESSTNTVGGAAAGAGNLISGNNQGVLLVVQGAPNVATGNIVQGNLIGTDVTGTAAIPNAGDGVSVNDSAEGNTIGGNVAAARNVISGNNGRGIGLVTSAGAGNTVTGNYIGTNAGGAAALPNAGGGINIGSSNNTIGGTSSGVRNVISGNGSPGSAAYGVGVFGTSVGNQIQGNYIGLNASGSAVVRNTGIGIQLGTGSSGTIVGGTAAGAGNVVSGNGAVAANGSGIDMFQSTGNIVQGNLVGTSADGSVAIPNTCCGIDVNAANNNTIGGIGSARNVISGNGGAGLVVANGSTGNTATGNLIGMKPDGVSPLPNAGPGISVAGSALNNTFGGVAAGAGNVIAFNTGSGISLDSGTGNAIRGNAVVSNALLGIDLGANGLTNNDAGDGDTGANNLQNFPVLTVANPSTVVGGTLNSASNTTFALDFFANAACDASGNGEGQRYLGSANVTTNGSGDASFSITLAGASSIGEFITATATDPNGNTSEFSGCRVVTAAAAPGPTDVGLTLSANPNPVAAGATLTYTMTVTNNGASNQATGVTATQTLPSGVTFLSATGATCVLSGVVVTCNVGTLNPLASVAMTIQVRADVGGVTLVSTAHVDTTTADATTGNNDASTTTTVTGAGTRQVWVADNGAPNRISIVNPDTNTAAGFINLAAPAYDVAFSPSGQRAYVVNFTTNNIAVIDTTTNTIVNNVAVASPVKVKVSPDGSKYYVSSGADQLAVFNAQTDALVTSVTVGGSPAGVAVSPDGLRVYVTNRDSNSVSVINAASNGVIATVPVGDFPVAVAIAPNGKRVFVSNYFSANVSVIDTATNTVVATPDVTAGPQDLAVTPNGSRVYVANFDGNVVSVINVATNVVSPTIAVAGSPQGIVVSPNGDRVYVTAYNAGVVRVIDTGTNTIVASVAAGNFPFAADYLRKP